MSKVNDLSMRLFKDTYFLEGETFEQWVDRMTIDRIGTNGYDMTHYMNHMKEVLPRVKEYISNRWFQPATPISANLGTERGMPISCFVREVDDSRDSIFYTYHEGFWLGSEGTGIGTDWSRVRSIGEKIKGGKKGTTSGVMPFLKVSDSATLAISQGSTRRSSEAVYLDVSHPEIEEFINFRKQSNNTDINRYCPNLHHAVKLSDKFMEAVEARGKWELKSPLTKEVIKVVDAFDLFVSILDVRARFQGEPYIFFTDNVNGNNKAKLYKKLNLDINMSNLCSEIALHTSPEKSNICCLGSLNLALYDEYANKINTIVSDCLFYLDFIIECFIRRCENKPQYKRAVKGAIEDRPLGLGVMGFHTLLQSKGIAFGDSKALAYSDKIFESLYTASLIYEDECRDMGLEPCELIKKNIPNCEYQRNATHFAIAPTMSISNLCNQVSQGVEPIMSNYYSKKLKQGTFLIKNEHLDKVLQTKGLTPEELKEVWDSIRDNQGSVQHLDCLTNDEKAVFKTAFEIDQKDVVILAANRQAYIDQAQSINLFFTSKSTPKEIYDVHMLAWKQGLKTLYYQRSLAEARVVNTNERKQIKVCSIDNPDCESCQ